MVHAHTETAKPHSVGYNLAVIAIMLAGLGLALAYGIDALSHRHAGSPAEGPALVRNMGGKQLLIPRQLFRYDEEQVSGFVGRIELRLPLPLGVDGAARLVDVTLTAPSKARPSARLLDGVYLHQFMPDELSGPPGLIGKPLFGTNGFANETVWYDAISPDPFVAKCTEPVTAGARSSCLRTVILEPGIAAIYEFDADLLAQWRGFDAAVKPLLTQIGIAVR